MNVAFDIDGTIDQDPEFFASLASALKAAGHTVYVITGVEHGGDPDEADVTAKQGYLRSIGFVAYDTIYVCAQPHDKAKAQLVQDLCVEALFDNDKDNAKACAPYCTVLLDWNAKI